MQVARTLNRGARTERLVDGPLVDAIARQDRAALAEAYEQHGSQVHALARGLCGEPCADDLTREIFLQLWSRPECYESDRGSLRSYLLMQAHSRAVDLVRSDERSSPRDPAALELLERPGVEERVSMLPDDERSAIVLAYFGGHTYREIARLLDVSEEAIKNRIRSGLTRLSRRPGSS